MLDRIRRTVRAARTAWSSPGMSREEMARALAERGYAPEAARAAYVGEHGPELATVPRQARVYRLPPDYPRSSRWQG